MGSLQGQDPLISQRCFQQKAGKRTKTFSHCCFLVPEMGQRKTEDHLPQASSLALLSLPIAVPKNTGVTRHKGRSLPLATLGLCPLLPGEVAAGPILWRTQWVLMLGKEEILASYQSGQGGEAGPRATTGS